MQILVLWRYLLLIVACQRIHFQVLKQILTPDHFLSPVSIACLLSNPNPLVSFVYIDNEKTNALLGIELVTLLSKGQHPATEPWASTSILEKKQIVNCQKKEHVLKQILTLYQFLFPVSQPICSQTLTHLSTENVEN